MPQNNIMIAFQIALTALPIFLVFFLWATPPTDAPSQVSSCMTPQEIETAVYELKNEIIERELHLIIVGDEYHPALKVPERKPEIN